MSHNIPEGCMGNSVYDLPWEEPESDYCPSCGSNMYISNLYKDMLECINDDCDVTKDLTLSGLSDDWF